MFMEAENSLISMINRKLIYNAKKGNIKAFEKLVEKYFIVVYSLAFNKTRDRDKAKSLSYEVFLRVFRNMEQTSDETSFMQLLFKSIKDICLVKELDK